MKPKTRQKSNRTSPKSEQSSRQIKSHNLTPKKSKSKTTTPNSSGTYFKYRKLRLPNEAEEESERDLFLKKHKNDLTDTEVAL